MNLYRFNLDFFKLFEKLLFHKLEMIYPFLAGRFVTWVPSIGPPNEYYPGFVPRRGEQALLQG